MVSGTILFICTMKMPQMVPVTIPAIFIVLVSKMVTGTYVDNFRFFRELLISENRLLRR